MRALVVFFLLFTHGALAEVKRVYAAGPPAGSINVEVLDFLWNPEVILTTDPHFWQLARTDRRWRTVTAVERGKVYLSPHLPFGWFDFPPGANRLLGVWWAGKLLYPQAFADVVLPR